MLFVYKPIWGSLKEICFCDCSLYSILKSQSYTEFSLMWFCLRVFDLPSPFQMFSWITLLTQWPLWLNQNLHHSLICDVSAQTCRHRRSESCSPLSHTPQVSRQKACSHVMFLGRLLEQCALPYCCVDSLQQSWPAGCSSVALSSCREGDWAKAFWHAWVPSFVSFCPSGWNAVKKRAGELEGGWKEFELLSLSVIQADFFAKMALDQELTVLKGKTATPS